MLNYHQILLLLNYCFLIEAMFVAKFTDFYIESVSFMNETSGRPFIGNVTLKRSGKDHPRLSFEFEITDNIRNYDCSLKVFYSPLGNNRFILLPYKFSRQPLCNLFNSERSRQLFLDLQNYSNIPYSADPKIDLCDSMNEKHYYWRNYSFNASLFPSRMPTGRFRVLTLFYKRETKAISQGLDFRYVFT